MQNCLITNSMVHELLFLDVVLLNNFYHSVHQLFLLHTIIIIPPVLYSILLSQVTPPSLPYYLGLLLELPSSSGSSISSNKA